ncbi:conserved hypothetical protein [Desulfosarcina cetonica]|uniref:DsbA family oxidoreductase n=1 Tax=Desulfosarcina cetonica TaxID=90730 RepID=UPI0012EE41CE|nr:DsbA family oxidoreductase [Desulfosarcina cetonica]VTR69927.1 conserved hypothetical protein [Desulfosarcina cetonica]
MTQHVEKNTLDIYSDYICPWCYLNTKRIEALNAGFNLDIQWHAFPLHPEIPEAGMPLEALFGDEPVDIPATLDRLQRVADEREMAFVRPTTVYDTRLAHELDKWAHTQEHGDAFHQAVFLAYFANGQNIARRSVLLEICRDVGLDPAAAERVLDTRPFRSAVDEDWQRSRELNVTMIPAFIINGQRLMGDHPLSALERLARSAGAVRRESTTAD